MATAIERIRSKNMEPGKEAIILLLKLYIELEKFQVYENADIIPILIDVENFLRKNGDLNV